LKLTIYTKKDCHLCEEAKSVLRKYQVELEEVDIESDPALFEKYQYEIPVVMVEEQKLFKYRVDEKKLKRALKNRGGAQS
jgi:glutaredoxin